jgi:hypothetical protein
MKEKLSSQVKHKKEHGNLPKSGAYSLKKVKQYMNTDIKNAKRHEKGLSPKFPVKKHK